MCRIGIWNTQSLYPEASLLLFLLPIPHSPKKLSYEINFEETELFYFETL